MKGIQIWAILHVESIKSITIIETIIRTVEDINGGEDKWWGCGGYVDEWA